jgi:hypothetical protein
MFLLASTGSSLILLAVLIVLVPAVAYGLYTVRGSGISLHRHSDQRAPGAKGPSEETGVDRGEGSAMDQDGTR